MKHKCLIVFGLVLFALTVSACGESGTSGSTPPSVKPDTVVPPQGEPHLSPTPFVSPTQTQLPLHSDRSRYQPTDTVTVTITNTTSDTIYAWDTRASCSIFDLEMLVQGQWQPASVAQCSLGRPAQMIAIAPGQQYSASIQAQTPGLSTTPFPTGTYRVTLSYAKVPAIQSVTYQVVSPSFQVQS